jgi:hypothetical protein
MFRVLACTRVEEFQKTQNLLSERTWEFKSPRPHQVNQYVT